MTFNSFSFWLVFPIIYIAYWLLPDGIYRKLNRRDMVYRPRKAFLILVSYLFYANWKPAYTLILFAITLISFYSARYFDARERNRKKGGIVSITLLILTPLLIFKYYNFVNESIWDFLSLIGLRYELRGLNWAIPIGISFYTFQALGYLFDVYYRKWTAEKSFVDYALFVCFFPQLFSGPISKASELLPQLKSERRFSYSQSVQGLKLLLWGMFMKLVLADRLGLYVDKVVSDYSLYNGSTCIIAAVFYSLQIYGDFAGYSFMAIGLAKTLGFDLVNNFQRPYFSASISDFWRRWHISLSRWLKDYVYIPLGGSRCSRIKNYRNILLTFLVSGIWHGANWTYIVWGLIHGGVQVVEKAIGLNKKASLGFYRLIRVLGTFVVVTTAWVFFRMPTLKDAILYIRHSFVDFGNPEVLSITNVAIGLCAIIIVFIKEVREEFFPFSTCVFDNSLLRWIGYVCLFSMIILCGALDSGSFIYGSF